MYAIVLLLIAAAAAAAFGIWYVYFRKTVSGPSTSTSESTSTSPSASAADDSSTSTSTGNNKKYTCPIIEKCEITGPAVCGRDDVVKPAAWVLARTADGIRCSQIQKRNCQYAVCHTPMFETREECEQECIHDEVDRRDVRPVLDKKN